jgi:hypothetical protein
VTLDLTTRLVLDDHIRFRRFESEGVVVNQNNAEALVLNDVATRLLEVTDGSRTLRDCATLLSGEFEAGADIVASDVIRFAQELVEAGLAHVVESRP